MSYSVKTLFFILIINYIFVNIRIGDSMGFLKSLFNEIKGDLKSEVRSEARSLTRETIRDVKEALKPKKDEDKSVQQPSGFKNASSGELSKDDKVFGKNIDEYREIFQNLSNKHGGDIAGIYNDPEYQKLDAETKEYLNRVYMPTVEQSVKTVAEAGEEYSSKMDGKTDKVQAMYDEARKDGVVTTEEQNAIDKEAMKVMGEAFQTMGEMTPKYMEKAGNIAQDLSGRVENEQVANAFGDLGDKFKDSAKQNETKDTIIEYSKSYDKLANMSDSLVKSSETIDEVTQNVQVKSQEMQENLETAANAVGMDNQDIKNAFDKGGDMSAQQATDNTVNEMNNAINLAKNGGSEEEIKDAAKKTLESTLNTFGSLFK